MSTCTRQFDRRNPILLIHGLDGSRCAFRRMLPDLMESGWKVYSLDLVPNDGGAKLEYLAEQVADYIAQTFAPRQAIDIVGYSMGGIVGQYYIQNLGGIDRVQRLITLSTPHAGSWCAYLRNNAGCQQLRPNSAFLKQLNQRSEMLKHLNFTAIWSPFDVLTMPISRSQWVVDRSVQINVLRHKRIPSDSRIFQAVMDALLEPHQDKSQALTRSTSAVFSTQEQTSSEVLAGAIS
ncbi:lipase [Phormidesmis priestleyi ULC007]|uniref:Lipase n=1 Tax=Phormidesmis priestleyi ULC007 TaxID=1920490 RepID=A0A2T1DI65_9CYAN|nr:alpha/beta fold hydrolase [Phormidesmis priestleyi]PSB20121.1 lipase [Phormidesmis priestleyi ULC007]PZO49050.1 MAG: lipase [Phormidesmis priestleyi]